MIVWHVLDPARDARQERLRTLDAGRYAGDAAVHGTGLLVQPLGQWWFLVLVAAIGLCRPGLRERLLRARVLAVVTAVVLVVVAAGKLGIRRPVTQHYLGLALGSFPSGHTADVTAILGTLLVVLLPLSWRGLAYAVALVGGALVASSRVLTGAHSPDDVLAGWLLGAALVLAAGGWLAARTGSEQDAEQRVHQPADLAGR